jgi:hypothetical protein
MKAQSATSPDQIKLIESGKDTIVLIRENITESQNDEGDTVFDYDEYRTTLRTRPNLEQYIQDNKAALIAKAQQEEASEKIGKLLKNVKKFIEFKPNGYIRYDSDLKLNLLNAARIDPMPQMVQDFQTWINTVQGEFLARKEQIKAGQNPEISYGSFEQAYGVNGSVLPDPDVTATKMAEAGIL